MILWFAESTLDVRRLDHTQMNRINDIATWHKGGVGTDINGYLIIQFTVEADTVEDAGPRAAFLAKAMVVSAIPGADPGILVHTVVHESQRQRDARPLAPLPSNDPFAEIYTKDPAGEIEG